MSMELIFSDFKYTNLTHLLIVFENNSFFNQPINICWNPTINSHGNIFFNYTSFKKKLKKQRALIQ